MPDEVESVLKPPEEAALPEDTVGLFMDLTFGSVPAVPIALVQAGARETATARLRHMLWHLFLPREGMAVVYDIPADSPRIWLAYLWRPLDLLARYGRSTWHLLRGQPATQAAWVREAWLEEWLGMGES
jgi:hypothetical protein